MSLISGHSRTINSFTDVMRDVSLVYGLYGWFIKILKWNGVTEVPSYSKGSYKPRYDNTSR